MRMRAAASTRTPATARLQARPHLQAPPACHIRRHLQGGPRPSLPRCRAEPRPPLPGPGPAQAPQVPVRFALPARPRRALVAALPRHPAALLLQALRGAAACGRLSPACGRGCRGRTMPVGFPATPLQSAIASAQPARPRRSRAQRAARQQTRVGRAIRGPALVPGGDRRRARPAAAATAQTACRSGGRPSLISRVGRVLSSLNLGNTRATAMHQPCNSPLAHH
eukprot:364047-Chlamydomonas_euryale.AAC.4